MAEENLSSFLRELIDEGESEYIEFKRNIDFEKIGEYISALANSAALLNRPYAYLIYGVDDATHEIVGTDFHPGTDKVKGQEVESWLLTGLKPHVYFKFLEFDEYKSGNHVVILQINAAFGFPVRYKGESYIRSGSYKKNLRDFPEKEKELWRALDRTPFELGVAMNDLKVSELPDLLDLDRYYTLQNRPRSESMFMVAGDLIADELLREQGDRFSITNLGAILLAKDLNCFPSLSRKALRIVFYDGINRARAMKELNLKQGYANSLSLAVDSIENFVTEEQSYAHGIRSAEPLYPLIMIREAIANALIHQDFGISGTSPLIEIFNDRIEISNPGKSLIKISRLLDSSPRSRNEKLASLMRRLRICEELGTGIDKIISASEDHLLPPPDFIEGDDFFKITFYTKREFKDLSQEDKVRGCYQHCCLRYVDRDFMTNSSLRARFGINDKNSATASRLIKSTIEKGLIRVFDENAGPKAMKYVPSWT